MIKGIFISSLLFLSFFLLSSCASTAYATDVSCEELGKSLNHIIGEKEYVDFGNIHLSEYFDEDDYEDICAKYSTDTNDVGEFGIFFAKSEQDAKEIAEDCFEYVSEIQTEQRAFIKSYAPQELEKLDGAAVRRYGRYVVYAVFEKEIADKVFEEIERSLIQQ